MSYTKIMKIKNVTGHTHTTLLKSAPDKKASSIVYGLHFLQVRPSLNIVYEPLRQIQTEGCIEWISKYILGEYLNDLRINSMIWLRNYFQRWPYLQKMGVWLVTFLTEVDFYQYRNFTHLSENGLEYIYWTLCWDNK